MSIDPTFMQQWFEDVWNSGDEAAIDRMLGAECVTHGLVDETGRPRVGPEGFKPFFRQIRSAFPDVCIDVDDAVIEGDRAAARLTVTGTHTGEGLGLPPTGRPVAIMGMAFIRVRNGQMVEAWNVFDFQGLTAQLTAPA
jgi:steroid delta-isomerase-like uncharacterized protein